MAKLNIKEAEDKYLDKLNTEGITVSVSKIQCYRNCHQAFYYRYVLKLRRKMKGDALIRGSVIHESLENYYMGKSWKKPIKQFEKDFQEKYLLAEREMLGDLPKMVYTLMENYIECWEEDDEKYDWVKTEQDFTVELPKPKDIKIPMFLTGFIDAQIEDNRGCLIGEHKTHKKFPDGDVRMFNTQSSLYAWVCNEHLGFPADRILWNYIRAGMPSEPKVLKDGRSISRAKIDSTPLVVRKWLEAHNYDVRKYQDLISAQSYDNWFRRNVVRTDKSIINNVLEDTVNTTSQMILLPLLKDKNIDKFKCQYCDYKSICQLQLTNPQADLDFLLRSEYEIGGDNNGKENKDKKGKSQKR